MAASEKAFYQVCKVSQNLSTLLFPKCLQSMFGSLHFTYTGAVAITTVNSDQKYLTRRRRQILLQFHHTERQQRNDWAVLQNNRSDRNALHQLQRCVHVHRLDHEDFIWIWSMWTDYVNLRRHTGNGCTWTSSGHQAAFSPPMQHGNEASLPVQNQALTLLPNIVSGSDTSCSTTNKVFKKLCSTKV